MSSQDSPKEAFVEHNDGRERAPAPGEETAAARDDAQRSDRLHVSTNAATPRTASIAAPTAEADKAKKEGDQGGSHTLGSGLSGAALHSLGLTTGTLSSVKQLSEFLPPSSGSSKSRLDFVSEASQTAGFPTGIYRSLSLQYSPTKTHQLKSKLPGKSQASLSPKLRDSQLGFPLSSREMFSVEATKQSSATFLPFNTDVGGVFPTVKPKHVHSETILRSPAAVSSEGRMRPLKMQVNSEQTTTAQQSQTPQGPRSLVPWIEAAIRNLRTAVGSPRALFTLGFFTGSRQSPSRGFTAGHSKLQDTTQSEDAFAIPRLPCATLILSWLIVYAHWKFVHKHYPERCASIFTIVHEGRWERMVLSAFHHADFTHLTSNVASFFFNGLILEAALGATYFIAVLAIVTVMVGMLNISLLQVAYRVTQVFSVDTVCMNTLAGVIVALGLLIREHFGKTTIHCSEYEFSMKYQVPLPIDLFFLSLSSKRNIVPMISGLLAGLLLAKTEVGKLVIGIPYPRRHLYVASVPTTPVTYVCVAAIATAHLYGPYAGAVALQDTTLTFRHPVWRLNVWLSSLYVSNVCDLAYVLLSVLAVGFSLEQHIGHMRFLVVATALLLAMNVLRDGLKFVIWKYLLAFCTNPPPLAPHVDDCSCGLVGAMLGLKAVLHIMRPDAEYQLASLPIQVHFWPGLLLELTHLHYHAQAGSTFAHVTGVLAGLAVASFLNHHCWRYWSRIPDAARSSTALRNCDGFLDAAGKSFD